MAARRLLDGDRVPEGMGDEHPELLRQAVERIVRELMEVEVMVVAGAAAATSAP